MENLNNIQKLAKMLDGHQMITVQEMVGVVTDIVNAFARMRAANKEITQEHKDVLNLALKQLNAEHDRILENVDKASQKSEIAVSKAVKKAVEDCKKLCDEVLKIVPTDGRDGKDADEGLVIKEVLAKIKLPEYEVVTPEKIRDGLTSLNGEKRLDISAIKGAEKLSTQANFDRAISILDQRTQFLINKTNSPGTGTGDVVGPASATDSAITRYDGTTGKLVQNSGVTIDDSNNLVTGGSVTTPILIGGTTTTSALTYKATTGVGAAGADHIFVGGNNGATEFMRILNSGNVGIGTTGPAAKLHVSQTDTSIANLFNGTTKGIRFGFNSAASSIEGVDNTGVGSYQPLFINASVLQFAVGTVEKMRITAAGNVGIGITAPGAKLTVYQDQDAISYLDYYNTTVGASAAVYLRQITQNAAGSGTIASGLLKYTAGELRLINGETSTTGFTTIYTAGSERMRISSTGNVGVGVTPTAVLHLKAGTATASTAPIKLTAGTVNTVPESGTIEFDGTDLFITI